ncbi:ABC transporter permease [Lachnospiraceae bacterium WCA-9-b2]|uniref:ABC transporter permease n=1 Tax=Sporofaciens musculi TaxID=2681861 RepID=A0A7X3ME82_9FIRM|nr:ABC transporter permease [Sporofaciens musculi]MXP74705.1 ABC transporter permease [Sporofaciens musculi]
MKKYLEIAKAYMKAQLIWRSDIFVDVLLSVAKILFAWILWGILFEGKEQIAGLEFHAMISYYIISSYLFQMEKSAEISQQMASMLRNGTFSKYMVIPVQTQGYFVAMEAGKIAFSSGIGFLTMLLWFCLFRIPLKHTASAKILLCGIIMVALGLLFMAQLNYFLGILTLRFEEISIFLMIKDNISAIVTGAVIPLALLPEWVIAGMKIFPFYYVTYLPSMLFIGKCEDEAVTGLFVLSIWCILFIILNQVTYEHDRIKYDGAGI